MIYTVFTGVVVVLMGSVILRLFHMIYAVLRGSGTLAITVHLNVTVSPIVPTVPSTEDALIDDGGRTM